MSRARFHNGLAEGLVRMAATIGRQHGIRRVALSGGVFHNRLLLEATLDMLVDRGFETLAQADVPCGDGGIAFGQAAIALGGSA